MANKITEKPVVSAISGDDYVFVNISGSLKQIKVSDILSGIQLSSEEHVTALPEVTSADDGKILMVKQGAWDVGEIESVEGVSF